MTEDITLYAMSPHMHLRGKSLKWVVTYPDGREQTILNVPKFDFNWQFNYELAEPLKIPGGQQDRGHRLLRQLAEEQVEPGAAPRGVLVRAELGRDVPAVHRILRGQPDLTKAAKTTTSRSRSSNRSAQSSGQSDVADPPNGSNGVNRGHNGVN